MALHPGIDKLPNSISFLKNQRKISRQNKASTRFSLVETGPSSSYLFMKKFFFRFDISGLGLYRKYRNSKVITNMAIVSGKAKRAHCPKDISGPAGKIISKIRTNDRLGGVPTKVLIPPIEQA